MFESMRKILNEELGRLSVEAFKAEKKVPLVVVLDNIRSLNNIGSVFRTSDAFLIEAVYLCGITAQPPHKDIQKTALGATDSVSWKYFSKTREAIMELKTMAYKVVSIEQVEGSVLLDDFFIEPEEKVAIVLGNEVHGVDQEIVNLSDFCLEIPQYGTKHSLNVSVCAGIVIWELFKKMK